MRRAPAVLMVGEGMQKASSLAAFLRSNGWMPRTQASVPEALEVMARRRFDLILSGVKIGRAGRARLISEQLETRASLFFSMASDYGCWWLPAVKLGANCADSPALPWAKFAEEIEDLRVQARRSYQSSRQLRHAPLVHAPMAGMPFSMARPKAAEGFILGQGA